MAIDPNIPLMVRQTPIADPLEQIIRVMALRERMAQAQEATGDRDRRAKVRELLGGTGGDPMVIQSKLPEIIKADPEYGMELRGQVEGYFSRLNEQERVKEAQRVKDRQGRLARAAATVLGAPPESRAAVYTQQRQALLEGGVAEAETIPEQYPGDAAIKSFITEAASVESVIAPFLRPPEKTDADPTYEQDRKEYEDFIRQYENANKGRKTTDEFGNESDAPYKMPPTFEAWREQQKSRGRTGTFKPPLPKDFTGGVTVPGSVRVTPRNAAPAAAPSVPSVPSAPAGNPALEAEARAVLQQIKTKEASGLDASAERQRLKDIRAQVQR